MVRAPSQAGFYSLSSGPKTSTGVTTYEAKFGMFWPCRPLASHVMSGKKSGMSGLKGLFVQKLLHATSSSCRQLTS